MPPPELTSRHQAPAHRPKDTCPEDRPQIQSTGPARKLLGGRLGGPQPGSPGPLPLGSQCITVLPHPCVHYREGTLPQASRVQSSWVLLCHWLHSRLRLPFIFLLEVPGRAESAGPPITWPAPPLKLPMDLRTLHHPQHLMSIDSDVVERSPL